MLKIYTNRDLSSRLGINLAKWKRWSREFLPPDPLGGMQSGYARQYNFNDGFKVFLGGYLVAGLKCTIPEAKKVLQDLDKWLLDKGFYQDIDETADPVQGAGKIVREYRIEIRKAFNERSTDLPIDYTIRGILSDEPVVYKGFPVREERYLETLIPPRNKSSQRTAMEAVRTVYISELYHWFSDTLSISEPDHITP